MKFLWSTLYYCNHQILFFLSFQGNHVFFYLWTYFLFRSQVLYFRNTSYPGVGVMSSLCALICLFHPHSLCLSQTFFCQYLYLKFLAQFCSPFIRICVLVLQWCFVGLFLVSLHLLLSYSPTSEPWFYCVRVLIELFHRVGSFEGLLSLEWCFPFHRHLCLCVVGLLLLLVIFMLVLFGSFGSKIRQWLSSHHVEAGLSPTPVTAVPSAGYLWRVLCSLSWGWRAWIGPVFWGFGGGPGDGPGLRRCCWRGRRTHWNWTASPVHSACSLAALISLRGSQPIVLIPLPPVSLFPSTFSHYSPVEGEEDLAAVCLSSDLGRFSENPPGAGPGLGDQPRVVPPAFLSLPLVWKLLYQIMSLSLFACCGWLFFFGLLFTIFVFNSKVSYQLKEKCCHFSSPS